MGTAHRMREPGKCSPDKRLRECVYSREIVKDVERELVDNGVRTFVDWWPLDLDKTMHTPSAKLERQRELALRVREVNDICKTYGKENCLYVSVHVNASGSDGKWHSANGWQVCVSPVASNRSRLLANSLALKADFHKLRVRRPLPSQSYWEQSLYVLNRTSCPAVLTENLFMDNEKDVSFLLSDEGRRAVVQLHVDGIMGYLKQIEMK